LSSPLTDETIVKIVAFFQTFSMPEGRLAFIILKYQV